MKKYIFITCIVYRMNLKTSLQNFYITNKKHKKEHLAFSSDKDIIDFVIM